MPQITQIDEPLADDAWTVKGLNGDVRRFRMVLGRPIQLDDDPIPLDESSPGGFWYCPCAVGFDGALEFNRFGGPGRLSALINACKWLDVRSQLIDKPALAELDSPNWLGSGQASWNGTAWVPPANGTGCPSLSATAIDGTGLVQKTVLRNPYSGSQLLTEEYTWAADQLLKSKRCYGANNGGAPPIETTYGYDRSLRFTKATSGSALLGPVSDERWDRASGFVTHATPSGAYQGNWEIVTFPRIPSDRFYMAGARTPFLDPANGGLNSSLANLNERPVNRRYAYDRDGRLITEQWNQSPGMPGSKGGAIGRDDGYLAFAPTGTNSMATSLSISQAGTTVIWQYAYDSSNRRRVKTSPLGRRSFFSYNLSKQLLEETRESASPGEPDTVEEYVYLGGRPVIVARSLFDSSTGQRITSPLPGNTCGQMQHDPGTIVGCGLRYIATDPIVGKPIAIADSNGRLAWTGEYQPMGARNRKEHWGGIWSWDGTRYRAGYAFNDSQTYVADMVPTQKRAGLSMKIRVRFSLFDLEPGRDYARIRDGNDNELWWSTGYEKGPVRTTWLNMPTDVFGVKGIKQGSPPSAYSGHWFGGLFLEGYEWTRFDPFAEAYGTPLGFPGMYYDEETEKFENWNRTYDPFHGNYLSPEPLLQNPDWVRSELENGHQVPAYAHARNNPVGNVDPNGLNPAGAAAGASLGSAAGPVGAAVGAAVGAVAGTAGAAYVASAISNAPPIPPISWAGTEPGAGTPYVPEPIPWSGPSPQPIAPTIPMCMSSPGLSSPGEIARNKWCNKISDEFMSFCLKISRHYDTCNQERKICRQLCKEGALGDRDCFGRQSWKN